MLLLQQRRRQRRQRRQRRRLPERGPAPRLLAAKPVTAHSTPPTALLPSPSGAPGS